ncbi:MAG TPA: PKD domain-containing protein [Conexibacter sp.]|nr:PKD domain-containing protein [Conexibacter sp.]
MRTIPRLCALLGAALACVAAGAPAAGAAGWALPATTLAASANGPSGAVVAVDPAGDAVAAWTGDDGAGTQSLVVRTRPAGGDWSAPVTLSDAGARGADAPAVTLDAAGDATVLWIESADGVAFTARAARRDALTGTWSAPHDFPASGPSAVVDPQTQVRADAAGDVVAAWLEHDSGTGVASVRAAVWSGGAWGAPATLSDPADASVAYGPPQIAPDASGGALVGWTAQRTADPTAYPVQTNALGGGGWATVPTDLDPGDGNARSPLRLVGVGGGDVAATWFETDATPTTTLLGALRSGGTWTIAPVTTDVAPACVPLQALGADSGGATVAWQPQSSLGLDSVRLTTGGWEPRVPVFPDSPTSTETVSAAAIDHGTVAFVAHDPVGGSDSLLASRRQGDGTWSRPADLLDAAPAGTSLADPDVATDGAGDALASWTATDGGGARSVAAAAFQAAGPRLSGVSVPSGGAAGVTLAVSAQALSTFATVAQVAWDFGDGSAPVAGASASHVYAHGGSYTVTVTATDSVGNATQATRQVTVVQEPPPPGGGGGTKPTPLLRPRVGGLRHGVLVLGRRGGALKLFVRNANRVTLTGGATLVRPRRGRTAALTLARVRSARFPAGRRTTLTLRLSDRALRALRAASGFRLPVVLTLRFRAHDGRRVTVTLRATLDASARFGVGVSPRRPSARAAC